jgi:hypothetical protein
VSTFDVDALATWSPWAPIAVATPAAPLTPGVYMARQGAAGPTVYIGLAGERRGMGLRGRLTVYTRGRGMVSGLGEAALDRALADPAWLRERLTEVEADAPRRAKDWGAAAVAHADLHVRWAQVADRAAAVVLERQVLTALHELPLWNRLR